jgi:NADH dehydrogenase
VVIVGAGFAGLYAAKLLGNKPVQVTLVDRRNYHLFQPLLYQVATAALSPGDIAEPIRGILRRFGNVKVLMAEVSAVDPAARQVRLADGSALGYDYLLLATGARHSYFGHDEWEPAAPGLKSLEDALEIRRRVLSAFEEAEREADPDRRRALLTFVVIGGGPTGVEMSGAIAEIAHHTLAHDFRSIDPRTARIVLVESGPRVLPPYAPTLSASAERTLRRQGVEVHTNTLATEVTPGSVRIRAEVVPSHTIVWAAGVAASPLGRSLGGETDRAGRVIVQPDLTVAGHPEIYVVGDLASFSHQTGKPLPGVAQVAIQGGQAAARNILLTVQGEPRQEFHFRDPGSMATIGRAAAVAEIGRLRLTGFVAWMAWLFVHVFWLIGFQNRLLVMTQWAWSYFTHERGARLITGPWLSRAAPTPSVERAPEG